VSLSFCLKSNQECLCYEYKIGEGHDFFTQRCDCVATWTLFRSEGAGPFSLMTSFPSFILVLHDPMWSRLHPAADSHCNSFIVNYEHPFKNKDFSSVSGQARDKSRFGLGLEGAIELLDHIVVDSLRLAQFRSRRRTSLVAKSHYRGERAAT
jgi:hypothetical protein